MGNLFTVLMLMPMIALAQIDHYVGLGSYVNRSSLTDVYVQPGLPSISPDARYNISPFGSYTLAYNRFNAGIAFAFWHTGSKASTSITVTNPFGIPPTITLSVEAESREHYATVPLTLGYDIFKTGGFAAGVNAKLMGRYLYHLHTEFVSTFFSSIDDAYWSDLDTMDINRFIFSYGGGVYAGYHIGRFMPVLELGALYDTQGLVASQSEYNKYLNLYAGLSVRFRLNSAKTEESVITR